MPYIRVDNELHVDGMPLTRIADAVGTPAYVYSWPSVRDRYAEFVAALDGIDHRICYSVKANGNLALLERFAKLGAGFDIVSGGELERVLRAGGDPSRVVFSGVGKSVADIDFGIKSGIDTFNVESVSELARIESRAGAIGRKARVSIRVNPDVDADSHPYISTSRHSKFGVSPEVAADMYRRAAASPVLEVVGIACHIGSQIARVEPFREALTELLGLVDALGIVIEHVDIGGGFGISYCDEAPFDIDMFGEMLRTTLGRRSIKLCVEPGRVLVAEAGILLTRVEYLKPSPVYRNFAVVDASMNDLIRPALYEAWHAVDPVVDGTVPSRRWDVVGPVCETGDFLALDRELSLEEGDLLAIRAAGAYGSSQGSNYNTRPRAPEVMVDDDGFAIVRRRETVDDMLHLEMPRGDAVDT